MTTTEAGVESITVELRLPAFVLGDAWDAVRERWAADPSWLAVMQMKQIAGESVVHELRAALRHATERRLREWFAEPMHPLGEIARFLEDHRPTGRFVARLTVSTVDDSLPSPTVPPPFDVTPTVDLVDREGPLGGPLKVTLDLVGDE